MLDPCITGSVIESFRRKRGLSQEVASGLAPISRSHLSAIERGASMPTLETLFRISAVLGIQPSALVAEIEAAVEAAK